MNELEEMQAAQDALVELKARLGNLKKINDVAGRLPAANEVFLAIGKLNVWHAEVTQALYREWPEMASGIQTRGPGR